MELKDKELVEVKREMQDKTLDYESMKGRLENAHADLQECRERIAQLLDSHVSRATMKKALQISARASPCYILQSLTSRILGKRDRRKG
eukprot:758328-Hanusia_phi.AAC.3